MPFGQTYGLVVPIRVFLRRSVVLAVLLMTGVALAHGRVAEIVMAGLLVAFCAGLSLLASALQCLDPVRAVGDRACPRCQGPARRRRGAVAVRAGSA
ncbi:hypothetical protein GCM10018787_50130 [Streptomyces thermodiastaticus]|nr:hypothetical protein GCM10018787_50130 [Streptomyces thermodiastaticus]